MRSLVVSVQAADVEVASDVLWQLGVRAVEERVGADGTVELWTSVGDSDDSVGHAVAALRGRWPSRVVDVDPTPVDTWREHARPTWVGDRIVMTPAWQDSAAGAEGEIEIFIEPAASFGLGDHPTTQLCVRSLLELAPELAGAAVLDVGCGSGVLSIVAARLGAHRVRAVDIAPAAVEATRDNAIRNGVLDRIVVDDCAIEGVTGEFDVVVANILAPALVSMSESLVRLTACGGAVVISGILADRHDHVVAALAPLHVESTTVLDGWAAVKLRR